MKVSITQLRQWFRKGLIPLQSQYYDWFESFWHKDEKLPLSSVENLTATLNAKASTEQLTESLITKQNTLTAGEGITIDGDVISADGVSVHNDLSGRDAERQHPISAIDGLAAALGAKATTTALEAGLAAKENTGVAYTKSESDGKYAAKVLMENLYLSRTATTAATLAMAKPTLAAANFLELTTTNQTINFAGTSKYVLTRILTSKVTFDNNSALIVSLAVAFSRNATVEFGARVFVNGVQVSSNQAFGQVAYTGDNGYTNMNNRTFNVLFDNLAGATSYEAGSTMVVELFTKQAQTQSLTTRIYAGATQAGGDRYSFVQYNFTAVEVNTSQLADKAVTLIKLADDVPAYFAAETTTVVGPSAADGVTVVADPNSVGNYIVTINNVKDNHIYDLTTAGTISQLVISASEVNTISKISLIAGYFISTGATLVTPGSITWKSVDYERDLKGYDELFISNNYLR